MKSVVLLALLAIMPRAANAQNLEAIIDRVTGFWARGDASAVASLAARDGISLDLAGKTVGPLGARQVTALLRRLFEEHETLAVRMMAPQLVGGAPARAFAEISWTIRTRGTTIPERTSVFIALLQEDEHWRILEIRFVRS